MIIPDTWASLAPIAWDTETGIISEGCIAPPFVCKSWAFKDAQGVVHSGLLGSSPDEKQAAFDQIKSWLQDISICQVGHSIAYDLGVVCNEDPEMLPLVWEALLAGRIVDTKIAEKLLNLSSHGNIDAIYLPEGAKKLNYSLADVVLERTGKNRFQQKEHAASVRLRFAELLGQPASNYPAEFQEYAIEDALDTLEVFMQQLAEHLEGVGHNYRCCSSLGYRTMVAFSYHLTTMRGAQLDFEYLDFMETEVERLIAPDKLPHLISAGFLKPAVAAAPYSNGAKDSKTGLPKMRKPQDEKFAEKKFKLWLASQILENADSLQFDTVPLTKTGRKKLETRELQVQNIGDHALEEWAPYISMTADDRVRYLEFGPVLAEFDLRAEVVDIKRKWLPRTRGASRVHFNFDPTKETGRASCSTTDLYPSWPMHQAPAKLGEMEPRRGIRPRDGHAYIVSDVQGLELCSFAEISYHKLQGTGIPMRTLELLNAGVDLHRYMGAQFAARLFAPMQSAISQAGIALSEYDTIDKLFAEMKGVDDEELKEGFKLYRTVAKPFNLGRPGGLGLARTIEMARAKPYRIPLTRQTGEQMFQVYKEVLPDVQACLDIFNENHGDDRNIHSYRKQEKALDDRAYWYISPTGMVRRGCPYTSGTNGQFLQNPGSDAFNLAAAELWRASTDPTVGSSLLGSGLIMLMHDEVVLEVPFDGDMDKIRALAAEKQRIFEGALSKVFQHVAVHAEPALTHRWVKGLDPEYDDQGLLTFCNI